VSVPTQQQRPNPVVANKPQQPQTSMADQPGNNEPQQPQAPQQLHRVDPNVAALEEIPMPPPPPHLADELAALQGSDNFLDLDSRDDEQPVFTFKLKEKLIKVQPIQVGASRRMGWYQTQIQRLTNEMNSTQDERKAAGFEQQLRALQEKLTRVLIPDFPVGVLDTMPLGQYRRMMDKVNEIVSKDLGEGEEDTTTPAEAQSPNGFSEG
jgi:hypothetical protein